eukprot:TRINITY_DN110102_c0_g1_i1.p1 TRINITY_DN110102_c0_g1~~TRINITY_DN110102_c0_g1_i1.p1  ORF type:complete len:170 (-),score=40.79 TRINITY_DN110102_c0_g1_i1:386-895(-)
MKTIFILSFALLVLLQVPASYGAEEQGAGATEGQKQDDADKEWVDTEEDTLSEEEEHAWRRGFFALHDKAEACLFMVEQVEADHGLFDDPEHTALDFAVLTESVAAGAKILFSQTHEKHDSWGTELLAKVEKRKQDQKPFGAEYICSVLLSHYHPELREQIQTLRNDEF